MITIFAGPMFSGKTTSLIDHALRTGAKSIFRPAKDTRGSNSVVKSHDGVEIEADLLCWPFQLRLLDTIYVDEAQFLSEEMAKEIVRISENRDIYLSMLDMDYLGHAFHNFRIFTDATHKLIKLQAKCEVCRAPASYTHRTVESSELILCGSKESYEPRCYDHFPVLHLR
jgi:thymidine kinase